MSMEGRWKKNFFEDKKLVCFLKIYGIIILGKNNLKIKLKKVCLGLEKKHLSA
jgi:hypothetical protein